VNAAATAMITTAATATPMYSAGIVGEGEADWLADGEGDGAKSGDAELDGVCEGDGAGSP